MCSWRDRGLLYVRRVLFHALDSIADVEEFGCASQSGGGVWKHRTTRVWIRSNDVFDASVG